MLLDDLQIAYRNHKKDSQMYVRNILKEVLQHHVLDFIGSSVWAQRLIFTGGTCLRVCFDLPRLSEDLDFDVEHPEQFIVRTFVDDLTKHFRAVLQYSDFSTKTANNGRTVYVKFPVLKALGLATQEHESDTLFVRLDFSNTVGRAYHCELSMKSVGNFSFLIRRYALSDLFSGKVSAILTRDAMEGKEKKERFKGRDFFDLLWFLEKGVLPNWERLEEMTGLEKNVALERLDKKIQTVTPAYLERDLLPFFADSGFVKQFAGNFHQLFNTYAAVLKGTSPP